MTPAERAAVHEALMRVKSLLLDAALGHRLEAQAAPRRREEEFCRSLALGYAGAADVVDAELARLTVPTTGKKRAKLSE